MKLADSARVRPEPRPTRRSRRARVSLTVLAAGALTAGCLDRPLEPSEPHTTKMILEPLLQSRVDKIDVVLAIDNSGSMSDKQQILATAVPDLVERLVNPRCVDDDGVKVAQPANVDEKCPPGSAREFEPIHDIHIGIISSSLGAHGSPACAPSAGNTNDQGHLLGRTKSGQPSLQYQNKGFLAWDHDGKYDPPGISDEKTLEDGLRDMVAGVGQDGCGYEAQLESWYRFLVDPHPIDESKTGETPSTSTDNVILQQRRDFLRPDSLVAIIMLTDENDCSVNPALAGYLFQEGPMWRARKECATDPNDPCCKSCADENLGSCPPDPTCVDESQPDKIARLTAAEDDSNHNLRCFDQKRRFGFDGLYPVQRYVDALVNPSVPGEGGQAVPNPLFADLDPSDENTQVRNAELVFFAGIVGVPWQDIARNPKDLAAGGFKNASEMGKVDDASGLTTWDVILGDPASYVPPADPMMVESIAPRTSGKNPITGDVPQPPGSAKNANSINGHEWNVSNHGDLQYACVFDLPDPVVCDDPPCDCTLKSGETADSKGNPLCQDATGAYTTTQYRAKAYPGTRELSVLRGLGDQGIVASVCPAYIGDDATRDDYGYRPAVGAIVDRLKQALVGQCLPHPLTPDANGQVSCLVLEASKVASGACSCDGTARDPVAPEHLPAVDAALETPSAASAQWNCFCEIPQLSGKPLDACQQQSQQHPTSDGKPVDGWCYVDPIAVPDSSAQIVKDCNQTERQKVRFVGEGQGAFGATLFITCTGD